MESPEEAELIVWVVTASDHQVQLLNEKPPLEQAAAMLQPAGAILGLSRKVLELAQARRSGRVGRAAHSLACSFV